MSKPHIVVVLGAWHVPVHAADVASELESLGYTVNYRQMPSVGNPDPPRDLSEDVAAVREMVEEAIGGEEGRDVVVICHSWGGLITSEALTGYSKAERKKEGKKGGVIRAGYIAAFLAPAGACLMDGLGGKPLDWFEIKEPYIYAKDAQTKFYNDLPEIKQMHWIKQIESHSYATFTTKTTSASWLTIPTSYLLCELDEAFPPAGQEGVIQMAKDAGADIGVTRISAGHSPFLSKVDETAEWIMGVAAGQGVVSLGAYRGRMSDAALRE